MTYYLVFSWEHDAFWRPNRCGYTRLIEEAGRYSKEEAQKICSDARPSAYKSSSGEPPEICFPAPEAMDRILRPNEAAAKVALNERTLRNFEAEGKFPKRFSIGAHAVGYLESDIDAWIAERAATRDG